MKACGFVIRPRMEEGFSEEEASANHCRVMDMSRDENVSRDEGVRLSSMMNAEAGRSSGFQERVVVSVKSFPVSLKMWLAFSASN